MELPETIKINGETYHKSDEDRICRLGLSSDDPLLKQLVIFLTFWFDPTTHVTLKTSGSTGKPKCMQVPKSKLLQSARMTVNFFGLDKNHHFLLCLSPEFIAGKMMIIRAMLCGANLITTVLEANPLKSINQPIDFAAMVPLQLSAILKENPEKMELIKTIIIGGSAIAPQLEHELQHISPRCWHTYGMTETLSHIALRPVNGSQAEKWFSPLAGVSVNLTLDHCLKITAPALLDQPVITHDLAEINTRGKFRILGRIDETIVSAGHKLHPALLEEKIGRYINGPFAIISVTDDFVGEKVVLALAYSMTAWELYDLWKTLETFLIPPEMPRFITSMTDWPMLKSGKTDRRKLKANIQQQLKQAL